MGQGDKSGILTPELCRAARGLLDWTQQQLAEHSHVSRSTIRDYEGNRHDIHSTTAQQLRSALENGGAIFVKTEDYGLGLCSQKASADLEGLISLFHANTISIKP